MNQRIPESAADIMSDPTRFGLPTFDDFKKYPEKYLGHLEDLLSCLDKGSELLGGYIRKHVAYVEGYRVRSYEEAQRILRSMGIREDQIEWSANCVNMYAGKCDLEIKIFSKGTMERRNAWG